MKGLWPVSPRAAARFFAISNLAFLGVDIALAHLANDFARPVEWAPILFSVLGTPLLVAAPWWPRQRLVQWTEGAVGFGAILLGIAGMVFHLQSGFFARRTLHDLVYAAPFVAPLSYVGVGLLIVLLGSDERDGPAFGSWLLLLAFGGFAGNFLLSVLDHAQNGFFRPTEWLPVVSAAAAMGFLFVALAMPKAMPALACAGVLGVQAVVGVLGFVFHVAANWQHGDVRLLDRFVFGAPAFAPLLFADLALLGAIGLWARDRACAIAIYREAI